jgi:hypothetical protein
VCTQGNIQQAVDEGSFLTYQAGVQHISEQRLDAIVPDPEGVETLAAMFAVANQAPWARELRNLRVPSPPLGTTVPAVAVNKKRRIVPDSLSATNQRPSLIPGIKFLLMAKQGREEDDISAHDGMFSYTLTFNTRPRCCCLHLRMSFRPQFCLDWNNIRKSRT